MSVSVAHWHEPLDWLRGPLASAPQVTAERARCVALNLTTLLGFRPVVEGPHGGFDARRMAMTSLNPVSGDQAIIVTSVNRVVFVAASVLLLAFCKSSLSLPSWLAAALTQLGLVTYGVYLLHALVRELCRLALPASDATGTAALAITCTQLVAGVLNHRFELPMMQRGERLAWPAPIPAHVR